MPYISAVVILECGDIPIYFEFLTLKRLDRGVSFFAHFIFAHKKLPSILRIKQKGSF